MVSSIKPFAIVFYNVFYYYTISFSYYLFSYYFMRVMVIVVQSGDGSVLYTSMHFCGVCFHRRTLQCAGVFAADACMAHSSGCKQAKSCRSIFAIAGPSMYVL